MALWLTRTYEPIDRAKQLLLQTRRRRFSSLLAFQILLTVAVLAKDPAIAFWIDILGATVFSLLGTSKNDAAGVNPDVPCGLPDSGQV